MEDIHVTTASMRSTTEEILSEVDSMPKDCIHWKPGPEIWTVMDNLCHIAEFVPYWTAQVEQVIQDPDKQWGRTHHDADRLAAVVDTSSRDLTGVKEQIRSSVARSESTLERFTPDQLAIQAPSRNAKWGLKPASFILDTLLVAHLKATCSQIPAQSRAVSGTATFSRRTSLIHEFDVPSAPVATTAGGSGFPVRRVFCVGRYYAAHAREMGRDPDREPPFFFTKWAETVVPSGTTIAYPSETSNFQYEAELVVAIGKSGTKIVRRTRATTYTVMRPAWI